MEIIEFCRRSTDFSTKGTWTDTLRVKDTRYRINAPHGLSHHERDLLTEGLSYLRRRGSCVFVSIEAGRSPDAEKIVRLVSAKGQERHRAAPASGPHEARELDHRLRGAWA